MTIGTISFDELRGAEIVSYDYEDLNPELQSLTVQLKDGGLVKIENPGFGYALVLHDKDKYLDFKP